MVLAVNVDALIDEIIRREGGFVDDPQDLGGATNFGITQATLSLFRGKPVTKDDVRYLKAEEARAIYRANYARPFDQYAHDEALYGLLVDSAVQHGVGRVKGWVAQGATYAAVLRRRIEFYGEIITARPANAKFARGWMRRIGEFIR